MARKRVEKYYKYTCSLTEETFKVRRKAENSEDLVSLHAYYEMHPAEDDRPEHIRIQAEVARHERIEREKARQEAFEAHQQEENSKI